MKVAKTQRWWLTMKSTTSGGESRWRRVGWGKCFLCVFPRTTFLSFAIVRAAPCTSEIRYALSCSLVGWRRDAGRGTKTAGGR
jgi:hypothetical protein